MLIGLFRRANLSGLRATSWHVRDVALWRIDALRTADPRYREYRRGATTARVPGGDRPPKGLLAFVAWAGARANLMASISDRPAAQPVPRCNMRASGLVGYSGIWRPRVAGDALVFLGRAFAELDGD